MVKTFLITSLISFVFLSACNAKKGGDGGYFDKQEAKAIAEDYIGVRTSNGIEKGLYKIKQTGVSTAPIVNAANTLLSSLNAEQTDRTKYTIDDIEWRKWLNVDNGIYTRQGISIKELDKDQKENVFALIQATFSAKGLQQVRDIMKTDQTLKELNNNAEHLDEELYFITIMGEPSNTTPWGWQVDGHHLAVNFFVLGDQIVFSPAFMGAEPVVATSGKHKGNILFQEEQNLGLQFMQSLNAEQQKQATIGEKDREDMKAGAFSDNAILDYAGIQASTLNTTQKNKLLMVIEEYISKLSNEHAKVKMDDIKAHLDNTWFAWRGQATNDAVFYYRIHSPVTLIEFDHQGPIAVKSPDGSKKPTRNHIHTMIRTPNGNDYGKDLLRQHLELHH